MTVKNVELWWPIGYGKQPLYALDVAFKNKYNKNVEVFSLTEQKTIGFRSAELVTDKYKDQEGTSMYFRVNGVPIFAKGANFIPMDSFEAKVTNDRIRNLIYSSKEANMNIIR